MGFYILCVNTWLKYMLINVVFPFLRDIIGYFLPAVYNSTTGNVFREIYECPMLTPGKQIKVVDEMMSQKLD